MAETSVRCEKSSLVALYVSGALGDSDCEQFEVHTEGCQECLSLLSRQLQESANSSWDELIAPLSPPAAARESVPGIPSVFSDKFAPLTHPDSRDGTADSAETHAGNLRYRKIRLAGTGGMGVVWEAWDDKMQRPVAIKALRNLQPDFHATERLVQEANVLARLSHPHIVTVYELSESEGRPALVLEYVDGPTLADYLRGQPVGEAEAISLLMRITTAVGHAHQAGIIHRDLKPSNILLRLPGTVDRSRVRLQDIDVKVSDFGLARVLDQQTMTHAGQILGTPCYMAPEQIAGDPSQIGPFSDVYGLGTILYELLTGRPPFVSNDPAVTMSMIREHDPVPPRMLSPRVSRDIDMVCLKCLAKSPKDRYGSAELLLDDLRAVVEGRPVSVRPISDWVRLVRWIRRNRRIAAMGGISVVAVVTMITMALLFAASEKALRTKASQAEASANRNAEAARKNAKLAEIAAEQAQKSSEGLAKQLQSAMNSMQKLLQITLSPDSFARSLASESQVQFYREALRAYREYLDVVGMNKPLEPEEIDSAITYVWLMESVDPQQSVRGEIEWIQNNVNQLRNRASSPLGFLNFDIRLQELIAREAAHRGDQAAAAVAYVKMAELIQQLAEMKGQANENYCGDLRTSAEMLMNAAGYYSATRGHQDCLHIIARACAVQERLLQLNPASDPDAIRLTNYRYAAVWEYHLMQDDAAALQAAEAADAFCSKYEVQRPELNGEFEQAKLRHWTFIQSEKQRLGK